MLARSRFGPGALWVVVVSVTPTFGWMLLRLVRQNRLLSALNRAQLDGAPIGLLLLDAKGGLTWINRTAVAWLEASGSPADIDVLGRTAPAVAEFCRDLIRQDPARPHNASLTIVRDGHRERVQAIAQPMLTHLPAIRIGP